MFCLIVLGPLLCSFVLKELVLGTFSCGLYPALSGLQMHLCFTPNGMLISSTLGFWTVLQSSQ